MGARALRAVSAPPIAPDSSKLGRKEIVATRNTQLRAAVIITERDLRMLNDAFCAFCNRTISYCVECADGIKREFSSLDDLLEFENSDEKQIVGLTIAVIQVGAHASFEISGKMILPNVGVYLTGPESDVERLSKAIDRSLLRMRPMYWYLARANFIWPVIGLLFVCLAAISSIPTLRQSVIALANASGAQGALLIGAVLGLAPFFVGSIANSLRVKFWPIASFSIGDGVKREERRAWWRTAVMLSVALSLVTGWFLWRITA